METIYGLRVDNSAWNSDFEEVSCWQPEKYGIHFDTYHKKSNHERYYKNITNYDNKYKFVLVLGVWERPEQRMLDYFRNQGLKIFLVPREPAIPDIYSYALFEKQRFKKESGRFYMNPDFVLAPTKRYAELWENRAPAVVTGHTRFDDYLTYNMGEINSVREKYGLSAEDRIIFFPAFPCYRFKQSLDKKDSTISLKDELDEVMMALEEISSFPKTKVVVKMHQITHNNMTYEILKNRKVYTRVSKLIKKHYLDKQSPITVLDCAIPTKRIVKDLIFASDIIVGAASTAILEAMLMKKLVINTAFGVLAQEDIFELSSEVKTVMSGNDLVHTIKNNDDIKIITDSLLVKKYLGDVDGRSCERICSAIRENI